MCAGERKARKNKRKKRKARKKEKQKTATLKLGIRPSHHHHHYRIIEPNQPSSPSFISIFSSSSDLHSSKNPTIPMLNSNLAYQKKESAKTNNQQPSLSVCVKTRKTKKKNSHFTGQRSCPHSKFAQTFCSTIVSAPQRQHVQRGQGSFFHTHRHTNTLALFDYDKSICEGRGCFFGTYPRSSRSTIGNSR